VVRLPRIISATDPAFGFAAAQAVFGWQFKPPTKGGQPVVTKVRIPFGFEDKPSAPAGKAK
jgi:outer membrane biosynthesis protein TonB